jgi:hypothetical protein
VGSLKTSVLGGEGLFLASVKGPGTVWLQSLPIQRLRATLASVNTQSGGLGAKLWYLLVVIFIAVMLIMGKKMGGYP